MTKSIYTTTFIAKMPKKVNFIMVSDYDDDTVDSLYFYLKSGSGNSKIWNCDSFYTNWGYIDLSNSAVSKYIREFEKEHIGANVSFGHKSENGDIHADWDWSEVLNNNLRGRHSRLKHDVKNVKNIHARKRERRNKGIKHLENSVGRMF